VYRDHNGDEGEHHSLELILWHKDTPLIVWDFHETRKKTHISLVCFCITVPA
jgi:hypothetical protein